MNKKTDIIIFRASIIISLIVMYSMGMYQYGLKEGKKECKEIVEYVVQHDTVYCSINEKQKPSKSQEIKEKKLKKAMETKKLLFNVSRNGKDFIKRIEGYKLVAYPDSRGYSIGYGHHSNVDSNMVITKAQAELFFNNDIKATEIALNRLLKDIPYTFNQNFIDGFASLIYNCGSNGVETSDFYRALKYDCRYHTNNQEMIKEDIMFVLSKVKTMKTKNGLLTDRRLKEYNLMIQEI